MDQSVSSRIIKAYDIRGLVDSEIIPEFTFALGNAFAHFLEHEREPATIVIGEDMRPSSPELADAFSAGARSQGFDVIRIGLASTDQLYFASGDLGLPGAMFTASHNPAIYNGIKLCKSGARPIGQETGLSWIRDRILAGSPIPQRSTGVERRQEMLDDYVDFLISLFPSETFTRSYKQRQLVVAIDAGNGMGGFTAPAVMARINAKIHGIFLELDGTFPNHEANPIDPKNLVDLVKLVRTTRADVGLAFDGDADRCFLVDEKGALVSPSALTALIAVRELKKNPGAPIIYNLISSHAVPEIVSEHGGMPLRSRVGHSYIKAMMAEHGAIFGGEHSGHFYFKDFWSADSGMLAALHAIAALLESGESLSDLLSQFTRYVQSGEINTEVKDQMLAMQRVREAFLGDDVPLEDRPEVDELDGLTFTAKQWWFNLRPSNTEPLLRLNVESASPATMESIKGRVLEIIKAQ